MYQLDAICYHMSFNVVHILVEILSTYIKKETHRKTKKFLVPLKI